MSRMKRLINCGASALAFLLMLAGVCHAGAWTLGQGKLYDRLALNGYYADDQFDPSGHRVDFPANGTFSDINANNYLEYGLTDRVTLINSLYFKYIEKEDDATRTTTYGVGDIDLAAKIKLYDGHLGVISTQGLVKIPEAYRRSDPLPLGNGQYDVELRLLYGRSLYPYVPGYCNFEAGYRWRFGAPSDEFKYLVEFGVDITKKLYGRVKLDGILSMDNGNHLDTGGNPTTTNNFDLGKLDMALGYQFTPAWGMEVGYTPYLYGQNTAAGAMYTVALTYQIK